MKPPGRRTDSGDRLAKRRMAPDDRRLALLEIGLKLFGAKAYEAVSIDEICRAAGVSRPLLQHYFRGKQTFFIAVVDHAIATLEKTARRQAEDRSFNALEDNMRVFFTFMREHPAGATLIKGSGGVPEVAAQIEAFRLRTVDLVLEVLADDDPAPETVAAVHCWNGVNETLAARLLAEPHLTIDWAARFSRDALLALLAAAEGVSS